MVPIANYLVLSAMLFLIGVMGVLFRRSALIIFMSIELMLNAVNLSFVLPVCGMLPMATCSSCSFSPWRRPKRLSGWRLSSPCSGSGTALTSTT